MRNVGLRSFFHIATLGSRIIETERPDIVFFSTTMFSLFALGPYWLRKHGCPYVLDFQDPWVNDYPAEGMRFGRGWKLRATRLVAKLLEPLAVRSAAHTICVSPSYPSMIRNGCMISLYQASSFLCKDKDKQHEKQQDEDSAPCVAGNQPRHQLGDPIHKAQGKSIWTWRNRMVCKTWHDFCFLQGGGGD